jgi:leucyl aminopeptidase
MQFTHLRTLPRATSHVALAVFPEGPVPRQLGLSRRSLTALGFEGKVGQTLVIPSDRGVVIAIGMGDSAKVTANSLRKSAAALARAASKQSSMVTNLVEASKLSAAAATQAVVEGMALALYRFNTVRARKDVPALTTVSLVADVAPAAIERGIRRGQALADAVCLARDLSNLPPNYLNSAELAARAIEMASPDLTVEVWGRDRLKAEKCNGILAVNAGSVDDPAMIRISYRPKGATKTIGLIGKGITFDSGGLSIKPSSGMEQMKMDMSGAGAMLSVMGALATLKPKVNVEAWLCCTDNLVSGASMKVSDVITYRNGTTVEVMNTDAEGRLVLADGLILAVEAKVDAMVDMCTLTGACMVALGTKIAGLMGNNQAWIDQTKAAADASDEPVWHLPLPSDYRKLLDSEVADMKNIGGPYGGALTAGLFLQEFVGDVPWVHLDIAGKERVEGDEDWKVKGATGFGVRLLAELIEKFEAPKKK